jgi:stage II sporulation protein GA (sporulation sigma-E factor processing peptidase)
MKYNNGYSYFNISFAAILSFTAISYGLIRLIRYWLDSSLSSSKNYEIKVRYKDSDVLLRGFADSGNTVVDYFSGLPVIICGKEKWENILPSKIFEDENFLDHIGHFRLLPFNTVGDSGIMPIFKPDEIIIAGKNISAMIGIAKSDFKEKGLDAVFNPKILK